MNNLEMAALIERKSKALKHCNKLLEKIDKESFALVPLNNTGVVLRVEKDDPVYLRFKAIRAQLVVDINSLEIIQHPEAAEITISSEVFDKPAFEEVPPSSTDAKPAEMSEEERRKMKRREYNRRYYAKTHPRKNM